MPVNILLFCSDWWFYPEDTVYAARPTGQLLLVSQPWLCPRQLWIPRGGWQGNTLSLICYLTFSFRKTLNISFRKILNIRLIRSAKQLRKLDKRKVIPSNRVKDVEGWVTVEGQETLSPGAWSTLLAEVTVMSQVYHRSTKFHNEEWRKEEERW